MRSDTPYNSNTDFFDFIEGLEFVGCGDIAVVLGFLCYPRKPLVFVDCLGAAMLVFEPVALDI